MKVFAIGRGQYENIGDIILRRQLLDWVRPPGGLHVYVGDSPAGYDEGLHLAPEDVTYRSLKSWYLAALAAAVRGKAAYVFKPGEIQLTLVGMKEHLSMLPLLIALRARGGRAIRAGVGSRNFAPLPRALMRPSIALSDVTLWRDLRTGEYMGTGAVMPDLAFGEGAGDDAVSAYARSGAGRDKLVVSMRADEDVHPCPYPTEAWISGIRAYAAQNELEIWAVTQVQVDDERTKQLAADLGGQALTWDRIADHDLQEQRLRELYRTTAIALSDRLHVIIAAFTEGAIPVGSLVDGTDKIDRHFRTIGIEGISMRTREMTGDAIVESLNAIAARRSELFGKLLVAHTRLRKHRDHIRSVLQLPATTARQPAPHLEAVNP